MKTATRKRRAQRRRSAIEAEIQNNPHLSDRAIAKRLHVKSNRTVSLCRQRLEKNGMVLPRLKSTHNAEPWLGEVCTFLLKPAPENDLLYDPPRDDDPAFLAFCDDIKTNKLLNPIGVSRDGYVYSGHRRLKAVKHLGWTKVRVHIRPDISYHDDREAFLRLLKSCNTQRVKTTAEVVREGIVGMEDGTWQRVCQYREEASSVDGVQTIEFYGEKRRSEIRDKLSLKNAIVKVLGDNEKDWPLSDRKIFYLLLNIPGLLRNDRLKTKFENSNECYGDVTDMVSRLRIDKTIPFDAIADETRPVIKWDTHQSVGTFINKQLDNLFSHYWRDLLQSQPNWIELLVEKNTVATALRQIAAKYTIPMTSGRGYSSLPPRKAMIDRFLASGRGKLVLIVVSDFDPEGEDIPNAFGISLRDDFELPQERLKVIKAALTQSQVQSLSLHEGQFAKEDSSRYKRFVSKHGERCWELEAVPTDTLREIVEGAIRNVVDLEAFDAERAAEDREQQELSQHRFNIKSQVLAALEGTQDDEPN